MVLCGASGSEKDDGGERELLTCHEPDPSTSCSNLLACPHGWRSRRLMVPEGDEVTGGESGLKQKRLPGSSLG